MRLTIALLFVASAAHAQDIQVIDSDERCAECHADQQDEVRPSIHAAEKVGCTACHGIDSVVMNQPRGNPHRKTPSFRMYRRQKLSDECGSCHQAELESMRPSGHYAASTWGSDVPRNMKGCIDCHAHHATKRASRPEILAACSRCHEEASAEIAEARALFDGMAALESSRDGMSLERFERRPGIDSRPALRAREEADRTTRELRVAQHGLRFRDLEASRRRASESLAATYNSVSERERDFARRWIWLLPYLALLAASMALVRRKARLLNRGA